MSRILRVAGAAGLALALLAPTAAHADGWSGPEQAGDVRGWHYDPEPEPCGTDTEADGSAEANEDITRLGVRHNRRSVVVTTRFVDLDAGLEQMVTVYLRTAAGGFWLDVLRFQGAGGKWRIMTFMSEEPRYPDPEDISECGGFGIISVDIGCRIQREIDASNDLVRVAVPRTCLNNPRWVRVGADAYRFVEPEDPEDQTSTVFSDGWDGGTVLTKWRTSYGPRVRAAAGASTEATQATPASSGERRRVVVRRDGLIARR